METLRIRKFGARYHLPPSAQAERERLDRVLREIVNSALELAIERAGIGSSEELCVDLLHVPVRLRLRATDATLIAAWSVALAEAIRCAAIGPPTPGFIRYTSRVQALADMVTGAVAGNFQRSWGWRELGIWRTRDAPGPSEVAAEIVRALLSEPQFIVPLLRSLAGPKVSPATLVRFAAMMSPEQWTRIARAALEAAKLSGELIAQAEPGIGESSRPVRRVLDNSALARAVTAEPRHAWQTGMTADATVRRAVAILFVLEADPGMLRAGGIRARAIVGAVADALYPIELRLERPPLRPKRLDSPAALAHAGSIDALAPGVAPISETRSATEKQHALPRPESTEDEFVIPDLRRRALTTLGGLLFLLHIVADLELADEIAGLPAFAARSFRWAVQQLALTLVTGAEFDDPAVLAFAGLVPESVSPSRGEPLPNEAERGALNALAARIVTELKQRILPDEETLESFCCRRAEIVADPGWIEVRLSLTSVSTTIRRAGLDLDLGFLPWLGVVMRFVYE